MTSTQLNLNLSEARVNRDEGIQKAIDSAERKNPGWSAKAWEMFTDWLSNWPKGFTFQIETFRVSASARGLESPPTARAYGQIAVRARKEGLIKSNGQKPTSGATAHRCYANEWQKI